MPYLVSYIRPNVSVGNIGIKNELDTTYLVLVCAMTQHLETFDAIGSTTTDQYCCATVRTRSAATDCNRLAVCHFLTMQLQRRETAAVTS